MIINLDFDGVLIPEDFEKRFFGINKEWRVSIDDYVRIVQESPTPPLNESLLKSVIKQGHVIRLLTNRNYEMKKKMVKDLGPFAKYFDKMTFCGGEKSNFRVEGIMIDNEKKYLGCGLDGGIHYVWNGK